MSVWGWAAVALFVGPIVAALLVPLLKWMLGDWRRVVLAAVVAGGGAFYYKQMQDSVPRPRPGRFLLEKD